MKRPEPQQDYTIDEARQMGFFEDDDSMTEEEAAASFDDLDDTGAVPDEDEEG